MPKNTPLNLDEVLATEREVLKNRGLGDGEPTIGLALSGGGIRSAAFGLGILTVFERAGLLQLVNYLSTVSGGGYIGAYFLASRYHGKSLDDDSPNSPALQHLRSHTNYLGVSSGASDRRTWAAVGTWATSAFPNLLLFVITLTILVILPRLWVGVVRAHLEQPSGWISEYSGLLAWLVLHLGLGWVLSASAISPSSQRIYLFSLFASTVQAVSFLSIGAIWAISQRQEAFRDLLIGAGFTIASCGFLLSSIAQFGGGEWRPRRLSMPRLLTALIVAGLVAWQLLRNGASFPAAAASWVCLAGAGGIHSGIERRTCMTAMYAAIVSSSLGVLTLSTLSVPLQQWALKATLAARVYAGSVDLWVYAVTAPLILIASGAVAAFAAMVVLKHRIVTEIQEAIMHIYAVQAVLWFALAALGAVSIFGPYLLIKYDVSTSLTGKLSLLSVFTSSGAFALWGPSDDDTKVWLKRLTDYIAPVLFLLCMLLVTATAAHFLFAENLLSGQYDRDAIPGNVTAFDRFQSALKVQGFFDYRGDDFHIPYYWSFLDASVYAQWPLLPMALANLLLIALVVIAATAQNTSALGELYRSRIVRCFLGAARSVDRRPSPLTGNDPADDLPLANLRAGSNGLPLPIINCALNVPSPDASGRTTQSFFFTPYSAYSDATGGHSIEAWEKSLPNKVFTLGRVAAISGAAINPSSMAELSSLRAYLMTLTDVRLNTWLGVPGRLNGISGMVKRKAQVVYAFFEMLGMNDSDDAFVNVSDGGHFENLGVFELIRRRCDLVVVSDAEQDEKYEFRSLGLLIRMCRLRFDTEIDIDVEPLAQPPAGGNSERHFAVGTIRYPNGTTGRMLYIKLSFTGREPADVLRYRRENKQFPQDPTSDQFFDEAQFESYRQLGKHAAAEMLEKLSPTQPRTRRDWYDSALKLYRP